MAVDLFAGDSCSMWSSIAMPSRNSATAFASPRISMSVRTRNFWFPLPICPPLRVLAPNPGTPRSKTATLRPRRNRVSAAESPVKPEPTMATSTSRGGSVCSLEGGAASHQYGRVAIGPSGPSRIPLQRVDSITPVDDM